jgi:hypothetical protein
MNRTPHLAPFQHWQWRVASVAAAALLAWAAGALIPRSGEAAFVAPALLSWLTLVLVWAPNLVVEVTLVAALFAFGPTIVVPTSAAAGQVPKLSKE